MKAPEFERLADAHRVAVWRYLRFLGASPDVADDLLQETFLEVWRRPFDVRGERESRSYLCRVARSAFLVVMRQSRARPRFDSLDDADAAWRAHGEDGGDEYVRALRDCVDSLAPRSRRALELSYEHDQGRRAIADELGLAIEGVKTLLRRIRDELRSCVRKRIDDS